MWSNLLSGVLRLASATSLAAIVSATTLQAQADATGTVVVNVVDGVNLRPIVGAEIRVDTFTTRVDSSGAVRIRVLAGNHMLFVRALGYKSHQQDLFIGAEEERAVSIVLQVGRPQQLDSVVTVSTSTGRFADFDRRRTQGRGSFITREQIVKSNRMTLADMLRNVRGVYVSCGTECVASFRRATGMQNVDACPPQFFVDGFATGNDVLNMPVLDVGGVELYRGASEVPADFSGSRSLCGVIAIWTWTQPRPKNR
jgi:hypothetical protein